MLSFAANIFVYAYITGENIKNRGKREEWMLLHKKADTLYTDMLKGKYVVIIPSVIVAEVCAVISRLTNTEEEGIKVAREIQRYCVVIYESALTFDELLPIVAKVKGSGIDSILAAIAIKEKTLLITNDRRLYNRLNGSQLEINLKLLVDMSDDEIISTGDCDEMNDYITLEEVT
jgi:predicted nucleic acid-binding protein